MLLVVDVDADDQNLLQAGALRLSGPSGNVAEQGLGSIDRPSATVMQAILIHFCFAIHFIAVYL